MKEEEQENYLLHDELVPIRIDLIIEKNRIQDCFTWNINGFYYIIYIILKINRNRFNLEIFL